MLTCVSQVPESTPELPFCPYADAMMTSIPRSRCADFPFRKNLPKSVDFIILDSFILISYLPRLADTMEILAAVLPAARLFEWKTYRIGEAIETEVLK